MIAANRFISDVLSLGSHQQPPIASRNANQDRQIKLKLYSRRDDQEY